MLSMNNSKKRRKKNIQYFLPPFHTLIAILQLFLYKKRASRIDLRRSTHDIPYIIFSYYFQTVNDTSTVEIEFTFSTNTRHKPDDFNSNVWEIVSFEAT